MIEQIAFLTRSLERRDVLSDGERLLLASLPGSVVEYQRGQAIIEQGSEPKASCLVLEGFTARAQYTEDGKRQLAALHIPGDFVDLHGMLLTTMDHSVQAISRCSVLFVPHPELRRVISASEHLGRLLWLSTLIDGAILRAWITGIGRRSTESNLAHLICEVFLRMRAVGLTRDTRFDFAVTQQDLADMQGLSVVHINKSLQSLKKAGLVEWRGSAVTIPDYERLARFAAFDPTYLNLQQRPR